MGFALFYYFLSVRMLNLLSSAVKILPFMLLLLDLWECENTILFYLSYFIFKLVESLSIAIKNQKLVIEMHSTCAYTLSLI